MALDNAKIFLFDVNYNEGLRAKLKDLMPAAPKDKEERISFATEAAIKLGYDFTADELQEVMLDNNDMDALELASICKDAGVCISVVEDRDACAATVECGVWCTAQTSPATVGSTFMAM